MTPLLRSSPLKPAHIHVVVRGLYALVHGLYAHFNAKLAGVGCSTCNPRSDACHGAGDNAVLCAAIVGPGLHTATPGNTSACLALCSCKHRVRVLCLRWTSSVAASRSVKAALLFHGQAGSSSQELAAQHDCTLEGLSDMRGHGISHVRGDVIVFRTCPPAQRKEPTQHKLG